MTPQAFIFIGRSGAGKGTQAKLLMEEIAKKDPAQKVLYVETGAEFRKFMETKGYVPEATKRIIDSGTLMPEFMPIYMWAKVLTERFSGSEIVIFDGTPRKMIEAKSMDSLFPFLGMAKPQVIYIDLDPDSAMQRLSLRSKEGRADDDAHGIASRQKEFEKHVQPVVEYYKENPDFTFIHIDGSGSIADVHKDIMSKIVLK